MFNIVSRKKDSHSSEIPRRRRGGNRTVKLRLERLERRCMLSVAPAWLAPQDVTVMSRNLYVGADEGPVLTAISQGGDIAAAAATFVNQVVASNPWGRLAQIAQEIAASHPGLVGIQEASLLENIPGFETIDYLQILQDALNAAISQPQARYTLLVENPEFTLTAPIGTATASLTDRDVILVRNDLYYCQAVTFANATAGHFKHNVSFTVGTETFTIQRGWESVDVSMSGRQFRFINTHLETPDTPSMALVQLAQTAELLTGPALTLNSVILVGDFNARADAPLSKSGALAYQILVGAGFFTDAWKATNPGNPGYTWGNELTNPTPLTVDPQRIDLVLCRGLVTAKSMYRTGISSASWTPLHLWPSDHAGVVATLSVYALPRAATQFLNQVSTQLLTQFSAQIAASTAQWTTARADWALAALLFSSMPT